MSVRLWNISTDNVDLREEFNECIDGTGADQGIGQIMIHRKLTDEKCACYNELHGSASDCKYCLGETYNWSENWIRGYFTQTFGRSLRAATNLDVLTPMGQFDGDHALIYLKWDSDPKTGDKIYRIRTNPDGKIYYPVERIEKWRVVGVEDKRTTFGRIEYFICVCERVDT